VQNRKKQKRRRRKNPPVNDLTENILETKRLLLRKWTLRDADALFEILRDAEVARHIADGKPFSREKVIKFLAWAKNYERENGFCRWKVVEKSSGEIVGSCGFARPHRTREIELGYLFARKVWGKGYATEIAAAVMNYGFKKLGFREIIAITGAENTASQKVLEKIGFAPRGNEIFDGVESLVYIKKKSDE
jgi:RimJ/RimL family protein N-acetyltransferase